ncbi:MAG TPA: hypothetical protein GXZ90_09960 [Clostridiales bacterium]|nr:hypothetical protein [Clostridiales bacterium]
MKNRIYRLIWSRKKEKL